jgi:hypothetical protein
MHKRSSNLLYKTNQDQQTVNTGSRPGPVPIRPGPVSLRPGPVPLRASTSGAAILADALQVVHYFDFLS